MFQLLLVIIYLSFISLGLPDSLLGSAWPSMYAGLSVPVSYAGILSMIIAGCTILSSLLSERLIRRLGTGKVTAVSVAMTAAALLGFSLSHTFFALCLWAVPYGLGAGSVDAALNNFVAVHYQAKHMSWLHCFWGIGATLGPYLMGASLAASRGWTHGYRIIALLQIALTAVLVLSLPLWKREAREEVQGKTPPAPLTLRKMIALPGAGQVLIAFFCYCSLEQVSGLWGSSYLVFAKGVAPERAASLIGLFYLGITAGRFLGGFASLRLDGKTMIRLGQGAAAAGVALLLLSRQTPGLCAGLALTGIGCAPIFPNLLHQTPERFGAQASQSMMGLQMACAYVGNTLSPPVVGVLTQRWSVELFPLFQVLFLAVLFLAVEAGNRQLRLRPAAGEGLA